MRRRQDVLARGAPEGSDRSARGSEALAVSNFRRFFVGQTLSGIGTWFQMLAQGLLVLKLTGSSAALGAVFAVQYTPLLLFGAWSGTLIDRMNVRRLIIAVSCLAAVQAMVLGVVTSTHLVTVWWVLALSFPLGIAQIFERAAPQAMLRELVAPDTVPSAVVYTNMVLSAGRLVGPALGGFLYATVGPAACFYVNAVSYSVVVVSMLMVNKSKLIPRPHQSTPAKMRDGLRFVRSSPLHRRVLITNALIGCLAMNFPLQISSMVTFVFHANGAAFGYAESINACAAVLTGVVLARRLRSPTMSSLALACFVFGFALAGNALAPSLTFFYWWMPVFGASVVCYMSMSQTLLQQHTPHEMVGRVMSLYMLGALGTTPIGALILGTVADLYSTRVAFAIGATTLVGCATVLWLLGDVRAPTTTSAVITTIPTDT